MSLQELLKEAAADIASFGGLSGEIRTKVKDGVAELTQIRDDIVATIATVTGSARSALASLQEAAAQTAAAGTAVESTLGTVAPQGTGPAPNADSAAVAEAASAQAGASFGA